MKSVSGPLGVQERPREQESGPRGLLEAWFGPPETFATIGFAL